MDSIDGERIEIDKETYERFLKFEQWEKNKKEEEEKKDVKKEKPKRWICDDCGSDLGPAEWDHRRLTRAHPDGCPRCGSTKAAPT